MVPFTIFQRLSSLGSGGGVNAGTIPPIHGTHARSDQAAAARSVSSIFLRLGVASIGDNHHEE
jgi:hypothetical protein